MAGLPGRGMALQRTLGKEPMNRLMAFSAVVDDLHRQQISVPHYYLFFIGIDPFNQGKGFAGRLIRPMLDRLDAEKIPCYLTTQNERNISLYEHFGFRVIGSMTLPGSENLPHCDAARSAGLKSEISRFRQRDSTHRMPRYYLNPAVHFFWVKAYFNPQVQEEFTRHNTRKFGDS